MNMAGEEMSIMMYIRTSLLLKDHKAFDAKYSIWPYRKEHGALLLWARCLYCYWMDDTFCTAAPLAQVHQQQGGMSVYRKKGLFWMETPILIGFLSLNILIHTVSCICLFSGILFVQKEHAWLLYCRRFQTGRVKGEDRGRQSGRHEQACGNTW